MKTLLVTFDYPPMVGGISTVFGTLWHRAGNDESLILAPSGRGVAAFDADAPVRTVRFPALPGSGFLAKLLNSASCAVWFTALAARHRPAFVIAGQIRRAGPLAFLWSRLTGKRFGLWVYGGETSPDFAGSQHLTRFLQRVLRAADPVFTISPFTSRLMVEFGLPADRIVEIPLGVREDLHPAEKDPRYVARHRLDGKLVFVTIARLVERKGIDTTLQALARIDEELPPWRYLVVSDGPYRGELERLCARLGLQERVTFTGFVGEDEIPTYHNLADVFVMPNRAVRGAPRSSLSVEGFGMVFVDAAACGKPVIAGRSGGAVDAVADGVNGILVKPGDVDDLVGALLRLADPAERERLGRAGLAFAARFSWDAAARALRAHL